MTHRLRRVAPAAAALVLTACAALPPDRGYAEARDLIESRRALPADFSPLSSEFAPDIPGEPIDVDAAVQLAFFNNPRMRETYARLGIGRAELEDARRLANPRFGYQRLSAGDGGGAQITRSLSLGLTDLLLLPARTRLAEGELDRLQQQVAAEVLALATEVEVAWYQAVGADQIAAMRELAAAAAGHSAELAQRFFDAGNIHRLQLEQERAAASQARIAAIAAGADALRARHALAGLLGLPTTAEWRTDSRLPSPRPVTFDAEALLSAALDSRTDLAAARSAVVLHEQALAMTRRWRWLGDVEVGYERESEADGGRVRGPSASLALPIFNQGQGAVARAEAELLRARAERDAQALAVSNDVRLGLDALNVAHVIAERYRSELLPQREAILARTQERVNFMLVGVFELLLAKQQEYDAYQAYLEAVRDYWIARAELRGAVGGRLPDDDETAEPTIGVEAVLPRSEPVEMDHSGLAGETSDPHAGHRMPARPETREADRPDDDDADAAPHHSHDHGDTP